MNKDKFIVKKSTEVLEQARELEESLFLEVFMKRVGVALSFIG